MKKKHYISVFISEEKLDDIVKLISKKEAYILSCLFNENNDFNKEIKDMIKSFDKSVQNNQNFIQKYKEKSKDIKSKNIKIT